MQVITMWIGAAIAGAVSIGTMIYQNRLNKKRTAEANRYNSPKEQLKRLREAGIAPTQFFSGSGISNQGVAPAPAAGLGRGGFSDWMGSQLDMERQKGVKWENTSKEVQAMRDKLEWEIDSEPYEWITFNLEGEPETMYGQISRFRAEKQAKLNLQLDDMFGSSLQSAIGS